MYIYPGKEIHLPSSDVVGFFDLDSSTETLSGRKFLRNSEAKGRLSSYASDIPRSFILACPASGGKKGGGEWKVLLCSHSTKSLVKGASAYLKN